MFDLLVSFLQRYHLQLLQIYIKNLPSLKKTPPPQIGALLIIQEKKEAQVSFRPFANIPYDKIKQELITKHQRYSQSKEEKLQVKEKWIIDLPRLNKESLPATPPWYLILDCGKEQVLFTGFPQVTKIGNQWMVHYRLLAEAHHLNEKKFNWTVYPTTHGSQYISSCLAAVKNPLAYAIFRSNSKFTKIAISGTEEQGRKYMERIRKNKSIMENLDLFRKNDTIGSPIVYKYDSEGNFSPQTLRHINTLIELQEHFGDMTGWKIAEIGGGYGGLCYVLSQVIKWASYSFYEIPATLLLAQKVLTEKKVPGMCYLKPGQEEKKKEKEEYDLCISEYAFSELDNEGREDYMMRILKRSRRAYLAMNIWGEHEKKKMKEKIKKLFKKVEEYPAYPKGKWANYIWVCKRGVHNE